MAIPWATFEFYVEIKMPFDRAPLLSKHFEHRDFFCSKQTKEWPKMGQKESLQIWGMIRNNRVVTWQSNKY